MSAFKNQRGFLQVLVLLLLAAGVGLTVYLVQQKTNFLPKAFVSEPITPTQNPVSSPICIQVVTAAKNSSGECKEFPTPCDIPEGWKKVTQCPVMSPIISRPVTGILPSPTPLSCSACNADLNKDGVVNNADISKINSCIAGKAQGSACLNMDFSGNRKVDQADLQCVRKVYNQKCIKSSKR